MITDRIESMYNHTDESYAMVEKKGGSILNPLAHNLPDEYQEVDYIKSNGNQWINTKLIAYDLLTDTRIIEKVRYANTRRQQYGCTNYYLDNDINNMFVNPVAIYNNNFFVQMSRSKGSILKTADTNIHTFITDTKNKKAYIDNEEVAIEVTLPSVRSEDEFHLFKRNGNVVETFASKEVYIHQFISNDIEIMTLIPCYIKSTNEVGMYDLVNGTFFGNQGTGAFTYGTEIPKYIDKNLENLSQAISTIDTHTAELEDMRAEMQKPTLNVFSNVMSETAYSEFKDALKDYSSAFLKYMEYNSDEVTGTDSVTLQNALSTNALNVSIKFNNVQDTTTTGGTPSPNPDYPQEIKTFSDGKVVVTNGINTTEIHLPLHSKNMFDKDNAKMIYTYINVANNKIDTGYYSNSYITYIKIEPNTKYTIRKKEGKTFRVATTETEPDYGITIISTIANHTGTEITITTEENANYLVLNYWNGNNYEVESQATVKETIEIIKGLLYAHELTSNDTLQIGYDGNTFIDKKWGEYVFTGEETGWVCYSISNGYRFDNDKLIKCPDKEYNVICFCTHFKASSGQSVYAGGVLDTIGISEANKLRIYTNRFTTIDELSNFFRTQYQNGTPVILKYEMRESEIIELENTQIPLLLGTNNISVESNAEPTELKVKYALDIFTETITEQASLMEVDE